MTDLQSTFLGIDAGGSGTKWTLVRGGHVVGEGKVAPLTAALLRTAAGQTALTQLRSALPVIPQAVHVGLPGLPERAEAVSEIRAYLAAALGFQASAVSLENDLDLAYSAHFAPGEGILLYAGTGSMAYHLRESGEIVRAGGRGYHLGDDGGGAWIGKRALRLMTDALDRGEQPSGVLASEIASVTGGLDWPTLRSFVYDVPGASRLAMVAPAVTQAALQGDPAALQILEDAAQALAILADALTQQTGPLPVRATGGALRSQPLQLALTQRWPGVQIEFADHALVAAYKARQRGVTPE